MDMTVERASRLAGSAHAGQIDKAGRPYTEHVFAVRDLLAPHGEHAQMAALPPERVARLRAKYARARTVLEAGAPETVPRATLLVVYTDRMEECRAFYSALGLRFVPERHGGGPRHHAAVLSDGVVFEIYQATAARSTGAIRLGFTVDGRRAEPALDPGRHTLTDPDGRSVDVLAV